jgi:hypothetical protein
VKPGTWLLGETPHRSRTWVARLLDGQELQLGDGERHDLFAAFGKVRCAGGSLEGGDYLSVCGPVTMTATSTTELVIYSHADLGNGRPRSAMARSRKWRPGKPERVEVAELDDCGHRSALVRFLAGAIVPPHDHPAGEELYVLEGNLHTGDAILEQGDWVRLALGVQHSLAAPEGALALLRNGHLTSPSRELDRQV